MEKELDSTNYISDSDGNIWLPLLEAAKILEKSQWSLYTLINQKHIKSRKIGHRVYIEWDSLCMYYEQREIEKLQKVDEDAEE